MSTERRGTLRETSYGGVALRGRDVLVITPAGKRVIGGVEHNLFHLRTNLRYGCVILRHYLDRENGDLFRALGRYNGSLGKPEYPNLVLAAWRGRWKYEGPTA